MLIIIVFLTSKHAKWSSLALEDWQKCKEQSDLRQRPFDTRMLMPLTLWEQENPVQLIGLSAKEKMARARKFQSFPKQRSRINNLFVKSGVQTVCHEPDLDLESLKGTLWQETPCPFLSNRFGLCDLVQTSDPSINALILARLHPPRNTDILVFLSVIVQIWDEIHHIEVRAVG